MSETLCKLKQTNRRSPSFCRDILLSIFLTKHLWVSTCLSFLRLLRLPLPTFNTHTNTNKMCVFYLLVTRCQQEQVEGTLPHAEPSICCCLSPYHAWYMAYQYSQAESNKRSATISRQTVIHTLVIRDITARTSDKDRL